MSVVKELPTKFQFGEEHEHRGSHLNLLRFTILPRIDHELPSARDDEIGHDRWDRYRRRFSRWRDVLNGCVYGEREAGSCLEEL